MDKTLAITAIALVAVIMVMGAAAPAMAQGLPDATPPENPPKDTEGCKKTKAAFLAGKMPEDVWEDIVKARTCPA